MSLDGISTFAACVNGCQTASSNLERVGECEFGCGYWALLETDESVAVTEAASDSASSNSYLKTKLYLSKTSLNEVAFIALLGVTVLFLIGYRRRSIRRRAEGRTYEPITGKVPYAQQGP